MITVTKSPLEFAPAGNPVIFTLSGDTSGLLFFKSDIQESNTRNTVYIGNIYPVPTTPTKASVNYSNQLSSLVRSDVDNLDSLIENKNRNIIGYYITATEWGVNTGGTISQIATTYTGNTFYAFEAETDVFNYSNRLTGTTYVADSGLTYLAKFLTLQPDYKPVNQYSLEQLYLLNRNNDIVVLEAVVNGQTFRQTYSGGTDQILVTPAAPETRATAYIQITGTGANHDNILVTVTGGLELGHYTSLSSGNTASDIAAGLAAELATNTSGYTVTNTSGSDTVTIKAPVGLGVTGNSIAINSSIYSTGWTETIITGETVASVIVSGYTDADVSSLLIDTIIGVSDPTGTYYLIDNETLSFVAPTLSDYTTAIVDAINSYSGSTGYWATYISDSAFRIYTPTGFGDTINGYPAWIYYNPGYSGYLGGFTFTGGATLATGTTIHASSILPNSVIGFTGGADATDDVYSSFTGRMLRINTSPKKLITNGITGFTAGDIYTIQLKTPSLSGLTEVKHYTYEEEDCNVDYMNIAFTNSMGGVDAYQFVNPQVSVTSTKLSIQKNNLNLDDPTNPYITDGVYNTVDDIYNSKSKATIKVYTKPMTDDESDWLTELINSKNVYVELSDGTMVPIQVNTSTFQIMKKKYNKELIQYQLEFVFSDNFLPSTSTNSIIIN